jgi:hypothetical protein
LIKIKKNKKKKLKLLGRNINRLQSPLIRKKIKKRNKFLESQLNLLEKKTGRLTSGKPNTKFLNSNMKKKIIAKLAKKRKSMSTTGAIWNTNIKTNYLVKE